MSHLERASQKRAQVVRRWWVTSAALLASTGAACGDGVVGAPSFIVASDPFAPSPDSLGEDAIVGANAATIADDDAKLDAGGFKDPALDDGSRDGGRVDARADAGRDGGGDARTDATPDALADAGADARVDSGTNPGPDSGADAGVTNAACPYLATTTYANPSDALFDGQRVIRLDLEMSPADWQYQLANPSLEEYRPATLTFCGERLEGTGMRFKRSSYIGGTLPVGDPKNPIVIDINRFRPGQRLRGLRKLDLEYGGDQMLVAERLNWELLRAHGANVSRVNHAKLYVNGNYIGVFTHVERVDKSYATYHYGNNNGQLYKHAYCGTFDWKGPDIAPYLTDPRCYDKEPSDSVTDYADLLHVIDVLNNTSDANFKNAFSQVWDIAAWLPMMAALQSLGYGDSPLNANNYYTYHPDPAGPTKVAPWDLDGGYWIDGAPCEPNANTVTWGLFRATLCHPNVKLVHRVWAVPEWRAQYLQEVKRFVTGAFAPAAFESRLSAIVNQIAGPLSSDPNRDGTDAQWQASIQVIRQRQQQRVANVRQQLVALGISIP